MCDSNDGRDFAWTREADFVRYLRDLVEHRYVLEALEALSDGPKTVVQMTHRVRVGRRGLSAALRFLGAQGLVGTSRGGSWDTPAPRRAAYHLTDRGGAVVATLSRFTVWTTLAEGPDPDGSPERHR